MKHRVDGEGSPSRAGTALDGGLQRTPRTPRPRYAELDRALEVLRDGWCEGADASEVESNIASHYLSNCVSSTIVRGSAAPSLCAWPPYHSMVCAILDNASPPGYGVQCCHPKLTQDSDLRAKSTKLFVFASLLSQRVGCALVRRSGREDGNKGGTARRY